MKYILTIESDDAEEIRDAAEKLTGRAAPSPAATKGVDTTSAKPAPEKTKADPDDAAFDSDGMPFDAAVHATSRAVNADGTWKAQRGKAEEAKAARAAFKASGGGIDAPADVEENEAPGLPGTKKTAPALPGAEKIPPATPVTFEDFVAKATAVLEGGKADNEAVLQVYRDATGQSDTNEAAKTLQTNESMRRKAVDLLTELENG